MDVPVVIPLPQPTICVTSPMASYPHLGSCGWQNNDPPIKRCLHSSHQICEFINLHDQGAFAGDH